MMRRVGAIIVLLCASMALVTGESLADSACNELLPHPENSDQNLVGADKVITSINAAKGDLRSYNPWVIDSVDGLGLPVRGVSTGFVMITRTDSDGDIPATWRWAQTGWVKTPTSPNNQNPVVYYQLANNGLIDHVYKSPTTIVFPPSMHRYQVTTGGSGDWSFALDDAQWAHVGLGTNFSWGGPNEVEYQGETLNGPNATRGDQQPGDVGATSKMKFRNLAVAQNLAGPWISPGINGIPLGTPGSDLNNSNPGHFDIIRYDGSNVDTWDKRCPD